MEAEQERGMIPAFKVFRSILNQPTLLTISSANAVNLSQTTNGFTTFQVNLPRPIFEVDSIQLLNANIPQCSPNVPDTACVFWYYRTSQYSGVVPNTNNLYYVRLLPSYYKPESILNSSNYGFNRTFVSYPDLATELALACSNDLAYYNFSQNVSNQFYPANQYEINFIPGDISITYNSRFNRFQMTGSNAFTPFATKPWSNATTYASNDIVYYSNAQSYPNTATYQSLVNANSNQNPFTATAYWKQIYTDIVYPYGSTTPYRKGAIVTYSNNLYQAQYQTIGLPPTNTPAGFLSTYSYGFGDLVSYLGTNYTNISPSSNVAPSNASYWLPTAYTSGTTYPTGFVATYSSQYWVALQPVLNRAPPNSVYWSNIGTGIWATYTTSSNNPNYRYLSAGFQDPNIISNQGPYGIPNTIAYYSSEELNWSPYALYEYQSIVRYNGVSYQANTQNLNYVPFDVAGAVAWSSTRTYEAGVVVLFNNLYFISSQRSQGQIPSIFSTYWTEQLWFPLTANVWSETTTYGLGALVKVNFNYAFPELPPFYANFISLITSNLNHNPLDANNNTNGYWRYDDAPTFSLNGITTDFDMLEIYPSGSNTNLSLRFPSGIAGQPYDAVPRRTLNSLTGFTWNGVMNPSSVASATTSTITGTSFAIQSQSVDLFNRLRPIPDYVVISTDSYSNVLLGANARTSSVTQTYTADGYANLNFSSIISLYTTIASASTMDTDRNTNLLATCPMNCVNLGVTFFEPTITNEIFIRGAQLDTISISMFDEFGNAYVVTNNGVVTITLRLTYKDRLHIK